MNQTNQQAVAVKTRVSGGGVIIYGARPNHNEAVAVKTRISGGALNAY